jgi:hypothetical protein
MPSEKTFKDRRTCKKRAKDEEDEKFHKFMSLPEIQRYAEVAEITNELLRNKYVSPYKMRILRTYFTESFLKTL